MHGINLADTSFLIFSTALVFLMTPALALFYGGMVKNKNILSTTMHSYATMIIVSLQWILVGYTLAFGKDMGGLLGNFQFLGLKGVGFAANPDYAANLPHQLFMLFQMMFAIITPALISGALAERMRFPAYILFILLWVTLIYDPLAHWVWGVKGWLRELGALDFAGGNVVHISSGVSGLVAAIVIGKRKKKGMSSPGNIPFTVLGAGLLWFGWFGFNAGSALGINSIALQAFITTNTSAAAAAVAWVAAEWLHNKKPTMLGAASGAVAGLVAITPGAGYVSVTSSIFIGLIGGAICFFAVAILKSKLGYDDALDAFGCHGIGGTWGGIATGIFASKAINSAGADGVIHGKFDLLGHQLVAIIATYAFAAIGTFIILKVVGLITPLRANEEEEVSGLDISMHGERAY